MRKSCAVWSRFLLYSQPMSSGGLYFLVRLSVGEEYCNSDFQCVAGCVQDGDCMAGEVCIEGSCASYECRTSELDCLIEERCIDQTCTQVEPSPCDPCTYADWEQGMGGQREMCDRLI